MDELKLRIKWSLLEYYSPIRIIISDWNNLTMVKYGNGRYMLVDCIMEYGRHPIQLCVPYDMFVNHLRKLKVEDQKLIAQNKAIVELMKTPRYEQRGMVIRKVELYNDKE